MCFLRIIVRLTVDEACAKSRAHGDLYERTMIRKRPHTFRYSNIVHLFLGEELNLSCKLSENLILMATPQYLSLQRSLDRKYDEGEL